MADINCLSEVRKKKGREIRRLIHEIAVEWGVAVLRPRGANQ